MSKSFTVADMKNLVRRRIAVVSIVFAVWFASDSALMLVRGESSNDSITLPVTAVALALVWLVSVVRNMKLLKDEERLRAAVIARNDERNILISYKATRLATTITLCGAAFSLIILDFLQMDQAVCAISIVVCSTLAIYVICWKAIAARS